MAINKIMVLGAGTMGMGIAQVFAEAGKTVLVRDIADAFIQRGEGVLKKNLEKKVAKGKITEEQKNDMLSRVSFTLELADAKDCDLVVEAAIEVLDIKKGIFKELDEICKPETILASNTSSISITAIAAATKRPEKVLGMHFFNPAPAMKLVEVIRGARTNDETFQAVYGCAKEIGKNPVEVGEAPGFVVNRILFPMINEAIIVLENGIASKEDIDTAMMYGANHKMGPLALASIWNPPCGRAAGRVFCCKKETIPLSEREALLTRRGRYVMFKESGGPMGRNQTTQAVPRGFRLP